MSQDLLNIETLKESASEALTALAEQTGLPPVFIAGTVTVGGEYKPGMPLHRARSIWSSGLTLSVPPHLCCRPGSGACSAVGALVRVLLQGQEEGQGRAERQEGSNRGRGRRTQEGAGAAAQGHRYSGQEGARAE